jgi:hypothetical protein
MEKRYNVFISSTYIDLIPERQAVMHALLDIGCFPLGMELFPAANDEVWCYIEKQILECDYYVLIVGGRYGSLAPDGVSYTEKEYQYAKKEGKEILIFLHANPGALDSSKRDKEPALVAGFERFRQGITTDPTCLPAYWSSPEELARKVEHSVSAAVIKHPKNGWVRGEMVFISYDELDVSNYTEYKQYFHSLSSLRRGQLASLKALCELFLKNNPADPQLDKSQVKAELLDKAIRSGFVHLSPTDETKIQLLPPWTASQYYAMVLTHKNEMLYKKETAWTLHLNISPTPNNDAWWNPPWNGVLMNIAHICGSKAATNIVIELLAPAENKDPQDPHILLLAMQIAFSGAPIEDRIVRRLLKRINDHGH